MTGTVPILSMVFMAVALAVSVALPAGLCLYFRKKANADLIAFFTGCAVMIIFAFILEQLVHSVVLNSSAGTVIQGNLWLYALYGGAMAGIFEETGRFIAFSTVLKKHLGRNGNALMYGAGHGGIEAFVLLGLTSVNNLIYSVLINTGNSAVLTSQLSGDALAQAEAAIRGLIDLPSWQFLLGGVERVFAIVLQIALSVLVWFAVKNKNRRFLYPAAILIHLVVDAAAALLSGFGVSAIVIEVLIAVLAILTALFALTIWRKESSPA